MGKLRNASFHKAAFGISEILIDQERYMATSAAADTVTSLSTETSITFAPRSRKALSRDDLDRIVTRYRQRGQQAEETGSDLPKSHRQPSQ